MTVMLGGGLLIRPATAISQLGIDVDKDWAVKGITSLKELVAGMAKGDLAVQDGTELVIISPGSIGTNLMCHGPGNQLTFEYPP